MTGAALYLLWQEAVHKRYSNYANEDRFNRMANDVFIQLTERVYRNLEEQKQYDELSSMIRNERNIVPNNNRFSLGDVAVLSITYAAQIVTVTTTFPHNMAVSDTFTMSDILGVTGLNTSFTVATVSENAFQFDAGFTPTGAHAVGTGYVRHERMIHDHNHIFTIKCEVLDNAHRETVKSAASGNPGVLLLDRNTRVRTGQKIRVQNVGGISNINGDFFAKMMNRERVHIYTDEQLLSSQNTTGNYAASNGVVQLYYTEYAHDLRSDKKASKSSRPTAELPTFIEDRRSVVIGPTGHQCVNVWVDYMTQPPLIIDANDNTVDLDNYYSPKLQNKIKNECVIEFHKRMANQRGAAEAKENVIVNP